MTMKIDKTDKPVNPLIKLHLVGSEIEMYLKTLSNKTIKKLTEAVNVNKQNNGGQNE